MRNQRQANLSSQFADLFLRRPSWLGKIQYPLCSLLLRCLDLEAVNNEEGVGRRQCSPLIAFYEVLAFCNPMSQNRRLQGEVGSLVEGVSLGSR